MEELDLSKWNRETGEVDAEYAASLTPEQRVNMVCAMHNELYGHIPMEKVAFLFRWNKDAPDGRVIIRRLA